MAKTLTASGIALALALIWAASEAALTVRAWRGLPDRILATTDARLAHAEGLVAITSLEALERVDAALGRVDGAVIRADRRIGQALELVDRRTDAIERLVTGTRADLAAVTVEAAGLLREARKTTAEVNALAPSVMRNTLGLIAAAKVTAGEAAQTMRDVQRATPALVASVQASAAASQQAAQSAADTASNLAQLTRPGPRWLRYVGLGLSVAAPASQIALPIVIGRVVR
jgi:hypothetical protein